MRRTDDKGHGWTATPLVFGEELLPHEGGFLAYVP
jgi:hypothetical protein